MTTTSSEPGKVVGLDGGDERAVVTQWDQSVFLSVPADLDHGPLVATLGADQRLLVARRAADFRAMPWLPVRDWLWPAQTTARVVVYRSSWERVMASPLSGTEMNHWPVRGEHRPVDVEFDPPAIGASLDSHLALDGFERVLRGLAVLLVGQELNRRACQR